MRTEMTFGEMEDRLDRNVDEGRGASGGLRRLAGRASYAALGMFTATTRRGVQILGRTTSMPMRLVRLTTSTPSRLIAGLRRLPDQIGAAFEESEQAGRNATDRILGRKSVAHARGRLRTTRSQARLATDSAARTARAAAEAVESAAEAVLDPRDTRAYEERTREELYELACERQIAGRSGMTKKQLIKALRR